MSISDDIQAASANSLEPTYTYTYTLNSTSLPIIRYYPLLEQRAPVRPPPIDTPEVAQERSALEGLRAEKEKELRTLAQVRRDIMSSQRALEEVLDRSQPYLEALVGEALIAVLGHLRQPTESAPPPQIERLQRLYQCLRRCCLLDLDNEAIDDALVVLAEKEPGQEVSRETIETTIQELGTYLREQTLLLDFGQREERSW